MAAAMAQPEADMQAAFDALLDLPAGSHVVPLSQPPAAVERLAGLRAPLAASEPRQIIESAPR